MPLNGEAQPPAGAPAEAGRLQRVLGAPDKEQKNNPGNTKGYWQVLSNIRRTHQRMRVCK